MTGNADRRQARSYRPRADAERAKAIVYQRRSHERLSVVGCLFDNGKATDAPGRKRAPGKPPHGTEARHNSRFDRCRVDDCREAP
jgi:hypothetical protein